MLWYDVVICYRKSSTTATRRREPSPRQPTNQLWRRFACPLLTITMTLAGAFYLSNWWWPLSGKSWSALFLSYFINFHFWLYSQLIESSKSSVPVLTDIQALNKIFISFLWNFHQPLVVAEIQGSEAGKLGNRDLNMQKCILTI